MATDMRDQSPNASAPADDVLNLGWFSIYTRAVGIQHVRYRIVEKPIQVSEATFKALRFLHKHAGKDVTASDLREHLAPNRPHSNVNSIALGEILYVLQELYSPAQAKAILKHDGQSVNLVVFGTIDLSLIVEPKVAPRPSTPTPPAPAIRKKTENAPESPQQGKRAITLVSAELLAQRPDLFLTGARAQAPLDNDVADEEKPVVQPVPAAPIKKVEPAPAQPKPSIAATPAMPRRAVQPKPQPKPAKPITAAPVAMKPTPAGPAPQEKDLKGLVLRIHTDNDANETYEIEKTGSFISRTTYEFIMQMAKPEYRGRMVSPLEMARMLGNADSTLNILNRVQMELQSVLKSAIGAQRFEGLFSLDRMQNMRLFSPLPEQKKPNPAPALPIPASLYFYPSIGPAKTAFSHLGESVLARITPAEPVNGKAIQIPHQMAENRGLKAITQDQYADWLADAVNSLQKPVLPETNPASAIAAYETNKTPSLLAQALQASRETPAYTTLRSAMARQIVAVVPGLQLFETESYLEKLLTPAPAPKPVAEPKPADTLDIPETAKLPAQFDFGDFKITYGEKQKPAAIINNTTIGFGPRHYRTLIGIFNARGSIVSMDKLGDQVFSGATPSSSAYAAVAIIRSTLVKANVPAAATILTNVKGFGYLYTGPKAPPLKGMFIAAAQPEATRENLAALIKGIKSPHP